MPNHCQRARNLREGFPHRFEAYALIRLGGVELQALNIVRLRLTNVQPYLLRRGYWQLRHDHADALVLVEVKRLQLGIIASPSRG